MRAFKRRSPVSLRRLVLQLRKWFLLTFGHGDKRRTCVPGLIVFWLYTHLIQKVTKRFSFFRKMHRLFLVRYWKVVRKNQAISLFDIFEKHEGRAKSAAPSRARVKIAKKNADLSFNLTWPLKFELFMTQYIWAASKRDLICHWQGGGMPPV